MTSTGLLFMLIGIFILFNTTKIVGVIQGNVKLNVTTPTGTKTVAGTTDTAKVAQ